MKKQSPSETLNGHNLDDVPIDCNNKVARVSMSAEKGRFHSRSGARYAALKMNGVHGSQIQRRRENNPLPSNGASNEK